MNASSVTAAVSASTTSGSSNLGRGTSRGEFVRGAVCGGAAAMIASACTHPLELLKVRLQLAGELDARYKKVGALRVAGTMLRTEGLAAFYNGLSASLLRQACYSPFRFGMFQAVMQHRTFGFVSIALDSSAAPGNVPAPPHMLERVCASVFSGAFGGLISSPMDLIMVRMQADGRLPPHLQRRYKGPLDGVLRTVRENGVTGLWRGCGPNLQRAMIVTATQFCAYGYFKEFCTRTLGMRDGMPMHFTASMLTGVVVAGCASPADVLRTRMMNSRKNATAAATATTATPASATAYARAYTSSLDCIVHSLRTEGPLSFYKGFLPYYARVGTQVCIMFVAFEQCLRAYDAFAAQL